MCLAGEISEGLSVRAWGGVCISFCFMSISHKKPGELMTYFSPPIVFPTLQPSVCTFCDIHDVEIFT